MTPPTAIAPAFATAPPVFVPTYVPAPPRVASDAADQTLGLRFQRCTWCDSAQPRPALMCRVCRSESFRWEESQGMGQVVHSPAIARKPVSTPRLTMIQLDEGPLVDAWVLGGPQDQLWPGARVRFTDAEDASGRPVFELNELSWGD
ncbi:Zn-ribbon domain-containing OB-fold protein [Streptacidiphilus fuscans]|uniref:DUF35 domain-containing protein n=1 Tax=Streptacidiphilus fuscans TaxID=2789292 RepID=A0A931B377_9ACTN|nr:hypothetical protein [Streptacidiphilus fuscans]MBF9069534.1 hypothetical protein [Streptacidiphilus fuscans]